MVTGKEEINAEVVNLFKSLLSLDRSINELIPQEYLKLSPQYINNANNAMLLEPINIEEVKRATFDFVRDKSPRPDNFMALFCKIFSEPIQDESNRKERRELVGAHKNLIWAKKIHQFLLTHWIQIAIHKVPVKTKQEKKKGHIWKNHGLASNHPSFVCLRKLRNSSFIYQVEFIFR